MTTNHAKWLLLGGLALTLATGGAVLLASSGNKAVREYIKAPVPKVADSTWEEGKAILFDSDPHGNRITGATYSPEGKFIAVAVGNQVRLLDAVTRKQVNEHALTAKAPATITGVAFSPKGDRLAVTARDHVFLFSELGKSPSVSTDSSWAVDGFDPHQVAWYTDADGGDHLVATNGTETRHRDPNGKEQAFRGYKGWEVFRHQPCLLFGVPARHGWLMQFDNGGDDAGSDFWFWNPADLKKCHRLTGHKHRPECGAASGGGKVIVTGDSAGHVAVWDGETFEKKAVVETAGGVVAVAVTPDGRTTAVATATAHVPKNAVPGGVPDTKNVTTDLAVTLYDTTALATADTTAPKPVLSWKTDTPLPGVRRGPASLAFSPDGKTLLAAFADPYAADNPKERELVPKSMGVKVWELVPKK